MAKGFEVAIADITVTEVQMVNQFKGSKEVPPQFTRGYGLTFGRGFVASAIGIFHDREVRSSLGTRELLF
ncbi:MAG: carbon-phosphorus lyase complex subunit PhnI [Prochloraceae cyanobacterium]